ncbi:MAG: M10 family metallopeptidase C-terminal domain-containing protein [Rhizobiaceae bacterium]|nr:M10 family metallopeptidase C-terminal domain-containing protein [Rhizobiaceae bacterium]
MSDSIGSSGGTGATVSAKGDLPTDSIDWGTKVATVGGKITYYFATKGESFDDETSNDWTQTEKNAAVTAMKQYENVINVKFEETFDSDAATFVFQIGSKPSSTTLGYFNPPGESDAGIGWFNSGGLGWTTSGLAQGGNGFITLLHEFGHAMGLAHPHDDGGTSTVMHGVTGEFDSYGDFNLNQGVYTTMTYNDGWPVKLGETPSVNYGRQATVMALDIAVLQQKYGANTTFKTGNDNYLLPTKNAVGTMYACIWDAGGNDTIAYSGSSSATIDLRPATLKYESGGGGYVSYVAGIFGGFTIAAGVVIENATGGKGADTLIGNSAANILNDGGIGGKADTMRGLDGNDTYIVGNSNAIIVESAATSGGTLDTVQTAVTFYLAADVGIERLQTTSPTGTDAIKLRGNLLKQEITGNDGDNAISDGGSAGGGAADTLIGRNGNDTYFVYNSQAVVVEKFNEGIDTIKAGVSYVLKAGVHVEALTTTSDTGIDSINLYGNELGQTITGNDGDNVLRGYDGDDLISGRAGADKISGGLGNDTLAGNAGADTYYFSYALNETTNVDTIKGFSGIDLISLSSAIFTKAGPVGALAASAFVANADGKATDALDRIVYETDTGILRYDPDGTGAAAAIKFAVMEGLPGMNAGDFFIT